MKTNWWKESVVYQIYPRSFKDSNGDGIGDLQGIISKLDYIENLGVDVVWLSPVYKSPNDDNGYDISDYRDIMDEFGTMADWEQLLREVHGRRMKLIMDLVVNHTSDEHQWFIESRSSKNNAYRDYYMWHPGKDGQPPNNWESVFSGSVWQFDENTGEYYLHLYSTKQPDLNWENEDVRKEIYDMMNFWLEKGIDGFRMDTITTLSKVPDFPDAPIVKEGPYQPATQYYINGPRLQSYLDEMKQEVISKYDILTVGETPGATPDEAIHYTNEETGFMSMLFQWEHIEADPGTGGKWEEDTWNMPEFRSAMTKWQNELEGKGWNTLYLSNHDQPRQVSRFGDDRGYWKESAKMLGTCLHMMKGTPFVYQGEELGMTNVAFGSIDDYRCVETRNMYRAAIAAGKDHESLMKAIHHKSRDNGRTPMQWDDSVNGGFTTGNPWIGVNPAYPQINAEQQLNDPDSIYHYYKKLISLRREYPIILWGIYELILNDHKHIYAYTRRMEEQTLLVINNFSGEAQRFVWDGISAYFNRQRLIGNYSPSGELSENMELRPYEAAVYLLHP
ncbi:glycoside hydrolase family 13 protein [Paenibacillus sp. URB8-2]|uniref:glycoside hydrolase family 13 protein n=1 Tax=Paenibacillus sp. URB8-2 TaxID=2741301 RepID=UPI0015BAEAFC|nr:alpha-glucosidase [Paenibacillus sp. URB8-2]BCG57067.1 alpha-glucosidase [Paenibacillus sp. URB8-2]